MICFQCYDEGYPAWRLRFSFWLIHRLLHSFGSAFLWSLHKKGILKTEVEGGTYYWFWQPFSLSASTGVASEC